MNNDLLLEIKNTIATITLNRPLVHNAFDNDMLKNLTGILNDLAKDDSVRVVLLTGKGKSFCSGADLNWMKGIAKYSYEDNIEDARHLSDLMHTLYHFPKPTIAVVNGNARGGGIGLIACCDIGVAHEDAEFCFSEVKLGLTPAIISPYIIAAIGHRTTKRYFLSADIFDTDEALSIDLIHEVTSASALTAGYELAEQIIENGPCAMQAIKKLLLDFTPISLNDETKQKTIESIATIRVSDEGQEGINAFLERRTPSWQTNDEPSD